MELKVNVGNNNMSTILIIEDDQIIRELYCVLLEEHIIVEAENSNDALNLATKHQPDLIITDLCIPDSRGNMPEQGNAFELVRALRKNNSKAKILVCSGLCYDRQIQTYAIVAGANASLPKNGSINAFTQTVDLVLTN